jgi:aldose 1-epimerase
MIRHVVIVLVVVFASATPASAQLYSAHRNGDVVHLQDVRGQTTVSILPSVGNIAFEMKVRGQNVLYWPYSSVEEFKARPGMSGIPFLSPWADLLDEPAFYANDRRFAFDLQRGNVRGAMPIHGFVTTTDQWQLVEANADASSA